MTVATELKPSRYAPAADGFVLPERLTDEKPHRGPRFDEDVWDLKFILPRTTRSTRVDFTPFAVGDERQTAKEYIYSRLRRTSLNPGPGSRRPMKATSAPGEALRLLRVLRDLREEGAPRLRDVSREHLDAVLRKWQATGPDTVKELVQLTKHVSAHGPWLTRDRLGLVPWPGRSAKSISGKPTHRENSTPRIPEDVMAPLLAAAVFYVETASKDIFAGQNELALLRRLAEGKRSHGQAQARLQEFVDQCRTQRRGLPALPIGLADKRPGSATVGGVVQAPNLAMIELRIGVKSINHLLPQILAAGSELGWEAGGLPTPMSAWPATQRPWRPPLCLWTLRNEVNNLRLACWIVIAYLSGMRDAEARELGRDCAFTEPGADGRTRYKIRGRVFKGRKLSGDQADWVVIEIVHKAVAVLQQLNDDKSHLFGYSLYQGGGHALLSDVPLRLSKFQQHLNSLFSADTGPYIPGVAAAAVEPAQHGTKEARGPDDPPQIVPWAFETRQFRRTLAWHIAHQPFGVVAGARQYKHVSYTIFEGYAGTSASGFADEVAAEQAVARLDYVEELYYDWLEGGRSSGGAANRVSAEFERVRRELGDLPGVVASPSRLRTMLKHLTATLHPGIINDCFHQKETAVCGKRARNAGRPLPMLDMCMRCPNSRRSSIHRPGLTQARNMAVAEFKDLGSLPRLQQIAISEHISSLTRLIAEIDG